MGIAEMETDRNLQIQKCGQMGIASVETAISLVGMAGNCFW